MAENETRDDEQIEAPAAASTEEPEAVSEAEPTADEAAAEEPADEAAPEEPPAEAATDEPAAEEPEPEAEAETEPTPEPEPVAEASAPEPEAAAEAEHAVETKGKRKRVPRAERRRRTKPKRERPKERTPIVRLPKPEALRGARQERRGVVVSSASDKTIVVRVETLKSHPRYKKIIRRSAKLHAHDERNEAKPGDVVRVVETRPLSKTKRWRLAEILEVAK
jgi:ribosomal protein uS17